MASCHCTSPDRPTTRIQRSADSHRFHQHTSAETARKSDRQRLEGHKCAGSCVLRSYSRSGSHEPNGGADHSLEEGLPAPCGPLRKNSRKVLNRVRSSIVTRRMGIVPSGRCIRFPNRSLLVRTKRRNSVP